MSSLRALAAIGNGLARRFADEGALLVIGDLDAELVSRVAADLDPSGERVRGSPSTAPTKIPSSRPSSLAVDTFGGLDGMHVNFANTADAYLPGGVVELPLEVFDDVMRVNTRGFVICAKHAIPAMIDSGGGSIVFTVVDRRLQRRKHPRLLSDEQGGGVGADATHRAASTGRRAFAPMPLRQD